MREGGPPATRTVTDDNRVIDPRWVDRLKAHPGGYANTTRSPPTPRTEQPMGESETDGMARLKQIVVDCETPSSLARFWAAALDEFEVRPYDDDEIDRLASLGYTPETDPGVILDGPNLEICFQKVELEQRSKTPVHLDIDSTDQHAEVERLVALGATVKERFDSHTWMLDPESNDFCVMNATDR